MLLSLVLNSFSQTGKFIYSKKITKYSKKYAYLFKISPPLEFNTNEVTIPSKQIFHCWGQALPYKPISFKKLTSLVVYYTIKEVNLIFWNFIYRGGWYLQ